MKLEEAGWLPAAACCVILLIASLTFVLMTSMAIPKAYRWLRLQLDRREGRPKSFLARIDMDTSEMSLERDLASTFMRTSITWGPGILLMILTGPLGGWERAIGWTVGLVWLAGLCLLNFARCRRVHCVFTGPFFLALAVVALLAGLKILAFGENAWNLLGLIALIGGVGLTFAPEMIWGRYWQRAPEEQECRP